MGVVLDTFHHIWSQVRNWTWNVALSRCWLWHWIGFDATTKAPRKLAKIQIWSESWSLGMHSTTKEWERRQYRIVFERQKHKLCVYIRKNEEEIGSRSCGKVSGEIFCHEGSFKVWRWAWQTRDIQHTPLEIEGWSQRRQWHRGESWWNFPTPRLSIL